MQVLRGKKLARFRKIRLAVGSSKACRTAITPRVASDSGVFSTKSVRHVKSVFWQIETRQYCPGACAGRPQQFGFQIVISDEVIDSPQPQTAQ
jgi:hypothetical protein